MRSKEEVALVLALSLEGLNNSEISRHTGIPRCTVRDWVQGRIPNRRMVRRMRDGCPRCGHDRHDPARLPRLAYVYLLGLYLGDGYIVANQKRVYRLRIYLDMRYPGIIQECASAMRAVMPANRVDVRQTFPTHNCMQVGSWSRSWPCLFPQHGPGREYLRYFFDNKSRDIRNIFKDACTQLGIPYKQSRADTISIARREGIEIMDSFVGPKT